MIKKNFNNYNYRSLDLSTFRMKDRTSFCLLTCLPTARHGTNKSIFTFSGNCFRSYHSGKRNGKK